MCVCVCVYKACSPMVQETGVQSQVESCEEPKLRLKI